MEAASGQTNFAHCPPTVGSVRLSALRTKSLNISLLTETIFVTVVAILAVRITERSSLANWYLAPGIFVAAALVATIAAKRKASEIGLNIRQAGSSLAILSWSCLAVFPITFLFLLLMRSFGLAIPLRPLPPQGQHWLSWLVYQFAWVAVAEEVFFRGYLQSNIVTLARPAHDQHSGPHAWIGVVISAGCFAAAHVIIQGQMLSILTFLPGLVLGWLFLRTRSLLPPILFHGLANAFYYWAAAALA